MSRIASCAAGSLIVCALAAAALPASDRPERDGSGQAAAADPAWVFTDVAAASGIEFRHSFGDDQFSKILEDTGSGVALIDYDGDGLLDVFLSSGEWVEGLSDPDFRAKTAGARSRLYRNLGGMKFRDVTEVAGLDGRGFGMGAVVGDYDADGDDDLLVLNWGPNVLWRNDARKDGLRVFTDVTAAAGVAGPETLNGQRKWSVNGLFFDADGDGDLDLFVANYLAFDPAFRDPALPKEYPYEGPESYRGQQSMLYRNEGDGTFTDVTDACGLAHPDGKSMGAVACDFDHDGDLDLFEAMDSTKNVLWRNDGGRFVECGELAGVAYDRDGRMTAAMHGSAGDIDGDGLFDLFVPDLAEGCLYRNQGLAFSDESVPRGLAAVLKGSGAWGSTFQDFDLDGDVDLLVVLGGAFDLGAGEHDRLFLNDGAGRFTDVSERLGPDFRVRRVSRGAAFGDLDHDGDVDYVVNVKDVGAPPRVMRNDLPHADAGAAAPHWLGVELAGSGRNLDAVGARVELTIAGGATRWRQVNRADSYLSQCDPRLLFGLGEATGVERLAVHWPSGKVQEVTVDGVDRMIRVEEGSR